MSAHSTYLVIFHNAVNNKFIDAVAHWLELPLSPDQTVLYDGSDETLHLRHVSFVIPGLHIC
jgi:hypothetical protein